MFTDNDKKELNRLMQKRRRSMDTGTRRAMLNWNSQSGKAARKRWNETGGVEKLAAYRAKGTAYYERKIDRSHESIKAAIKHRQEWTGKDEKRLIDLHKKGLAYPQIAPILGRSIKSIEKKAARLKKG